AMATAAAADGPLRQVLVRCGHEAESLPEGAIVVQGDTMEANDDGSLMLALVRASLGLSPERVLLHEVTGPEAGEALAALGRGLKGGVISIRAATVQAGLGRLASLTGLASGLGAALVENPASHTARARYVASTFELALGVARFADGVSRVVQVSALGIGEDGTPEVTDLVLWDPDTASCKRTGERPELLADLQRRGIAIDSSWSG
ncbi:MAG: hypothetical protein JKY37_04565, partial [Nannocystaceae bacterium]|nr:hypothetical protein [Nannocystaceae bacterium]